MNGFWILLISVITLTWHSGAIGQYDITTRCNPMEKPTFIKISHTGIAPIGGAEVVIPSQTLSTCARICADNEDGLGGEFNCAGFDFLQQRASCMLSSELFSTNAIDIDSLIVQDIKANLNPNNDMTSKEQEQILRKKFGIIETEENEVAMREKVFGLSFGQTGFYKKICLRALSASYVPVNASYSFEQVTKHVLLGATEEVVKADSLSQCLGACLESKELFDFLCRSSMYYYETRDCLLNAMDRKTAHTPLSNETEGFVVDYFENHVIGCKLGALENPENAPEHCRLHGTPLTNKGNAVVARNTDATDTKDGQGTARVGNKTAWRKRVFRLLTLLKANKKGRGKKAAAPLKPVIKPLRTLHAAPENPFDVEEEGGLDYDWPKMIGAECGPGSISQYILITEKDMLDEHDFTIKSVSRGACQHFCSSNSAENGELFSCKAYAYKSDRQTCYLMDETATPRGIGQLSDVKGVEVYEKVCLTAQTTCIKIPAFERIVDHVLIGFAQVVLEDIRSDERCLSECMRSHLSMDFECLSVMYYYDTQECILNYDSRLSEGNEEFFSNATDGFRVDYFDNMCAVRRRQSGEKSSACPQKGESTFLQYNMTEQSEFDTATISGISLEECLKKCDSISNFTCNSADYRIADTTCTLSYVDSRTSPLVTIPDTNHYERHCIEGAQYICSGLNISFTVIPSGFLVGYEMLTVSGVSEDECLALCLQDPSNSCQSANYIKKNSTCTLNNGTVADDLLSEAPESNYYENHCFLFSAKSKAVVISNNFLGEVAAQVTGVELFTDCQYGGMKVALSAQQPFNGYLFAKNKFGTCRTDISNQANAELTLTFPERVQGYDGGNPEKDCGVMEVGRSKYSALVIVTMNNLGIPGLVTEEDRFYNVSCDYASFIQNKVVATGPGMLVNNIPKIPSLLPDGQIYIPAPIVISLQRDGADVQTGILGEQLELAFNYAPGFDPNMMGVFIRQCSASRSYGPPPQPDPLVLIEDGCPMPAVQRAIIPGPLTETPRGFSAPFTVFKFDGGPSVKITCQVDMCEGGCNPTTCNINGIPQQSFGRRKRSFKPRIIREIELTTDIENLVNDSIAIDFNSSELFKTTVQSSITSTTTELPENIDKSKEVNKKKVKSKVPEKGPSAENSLKETEGSKFKQGMGVDSHMSKERLQNLHDSSNYEENFFMMEMSRNRQVCLKRATFVGVFLFLGILCVCQVVFVAIYTLRKWMRTDKKVL